MKRGAAMNLLCKQMSQPPENRAKAAEAALVSAMGDLPDDLAKLLN